MSRYFRIMCCAAEASRPFEIKYDKAAEIKRDIMRLHTAGSVGAYQVILSDELLVEEH